MKPLAIALTLLTLAALGTSQDIPVELVASTPPLTPAEEKKAFRLPPGFEAQLVAAEPDIAKPMNFAFDERGRIWLTDTLEYPFPAAPGKKPRDTVKILEDFGPDGRARKITTFADGLNIPIGLLPLPGGKDAIVYSIPAIQKVTDTDSDGKADKRAPLYEKYGFVDTHGMTSSFTWGLDGWVYACHGFRNDSTIRAADGSKITMNSGNVYRFKIDGSRVEQVTWGQVNPFGLCFDPLGNLYSADCHSMPIYQLLRGAYYPSFGKPHDGLGYGPELMHHQHGSTGIAGITIYAADHFPTKYQGTAFIGNVVTSRINHDRIEWHGSSPRAIEQPDFLRSDDPWFRPVDIKLGPDGALYVADFYNCIIGHYEVDLHHPKRDRHRGRLWRIVYRGPDGKGKPVAPRADWSKASIAELIEDLGHPNLTVRTIATHQLAQRGEPAVKPMKAAMKPAAQNWVRAHGLWVLERLGALDNTTLAAAVRDTDLEVRVHAQRVLSERGRLTDEQRSLMLDGLKDKNANVQRAAADALGQHPETRNLRPLLDRLYSIPIEDSHLKHVTRMALRNQLRDSKPWPLPLTGMTPNDEATLADVAVGVHTLDSARFLLQYLRDTKEPRGDLASMAGHIARHGDDRTTAALVAVARAHRTADLDLQLNLYRAIEGGTAARGGRLGDEARQWASGLVPNLLASRDAGKVQAGITLAGSLRLADQQERLQAILLNSKATEGQRVAALDALAAIDAPRHVALFGKVLGGASDNFKVRLQAGVVLARLNQPEARAQLLQALQTSPAPVQNLIAAALVGTPQGAEALLQAVEAGKASARLLQERGVEGRLKEARIKDLDKRVAKLTAGLPPADQRINELMKQRRDGFLTARRDPDLGVKVFEKHCANCHQISGKGARFGPQLDGIGVRGLERLLEDTLDPNRNVDQAFRTTVLNLKSGQVVMGLFVREEGAILVMADAQGKEVRVKKADVEERLMSQMSPMPANLADQIPETEFYHLIAYLLTQRPGEK